MWQLLINYRALVTSSNHIINSRIILYNTDILHFCPEISFMVSLEKAMTLLVFQANLLMKLELYSSSK